jgi:hypothetical protein
VLLLLPLLGVAGASIGVLAPRIGEVGSSI